MKSLEQNEAVFHDRVQHLWGIVLYEFQQEQKGHYHHEQPHGSNMLKVPGTQVITENTWPCSFDMCSIGLAIRKRLDVRTTSRQMQNVLHKRGCSGDHDHQQIAGNTISQGKTMLRSQFSEHYPAKFAKQVARILPSEKSKPEMSLVSAEEHRTKDEHRCNRSQILKFRFNRRSKSQRIPEHDHANG